jgi:hypothetical protein
MDFVFDRTAEGRVVKCLTIVDDATQEAVAIEVERVISGQGVSRVLDRLAGHAARLATSDQDRQRQVFLR